MARITRLGFLILAAFILAGCKRSPVSQREIATRVLAEYVRKEAKPRAVLVVSNPYAEMKGHRGDVYTFQKAGVDGLRNGFGADITLKIGFAKLKPEAIRDVTSVYAPPTTTTPLSYLVSETAFDDLGRENPDCDVFVSLIGLPANTAISGFWLKPAPRLALLLPDFSVLGDPGTVRQAFKSGKIIAAVIPKPRAPTDERTSSDYKAEFERRFILVTAENIDQWLGALLR